MSVNVEAIPQELRDRPQWVTWRPGTKIPHHPTTHKPASSTDPATWATFEVALAGWQENNVRYAGIGYCFSPDDPYTGVDLDDCMVNGELLPGAHRLVMKLNSYSEVSPSGQGVKVIVRASKPAGDCKWPGVNWDGGMGQVEMYDHARYFTITGNALPDTPTEIQSRQAEVEAVYGTLTKAKKPPRGPVASVSGSTPLDVVTRCKNFLKVCPDAISGAGGHDRTLHAACETMRFGLSDADALAVMEWWSAEKSGGEPWNARQIQHKLSDARKKVTGAGEIGIRLRANGLGAPPPVAISAPPKGASAAVLERLAKIVSGEYANAPWPWPSVTKLTQSLLPGAITLICGTPGVSKSFLVLNAAAGWLEMGVPFSVFMLEEDHTYHCQRFLAIASSKSNMTDLDWVKANGPGAIDMGKTHAAAVDALGERLYAAPDNIIGLDALADWYESVAATSRVVVIDPITAAAAGKDRWLADEKFMERAKTIARESGTSLVLMTHPKLGQRKGAPNLDDLAGGAAYVRFAQTVMVLANRKPAEDVLCASPMGRVSANPNRIIHLRKCRNGRGTGMDIGFEFGHDDLVYTELGVICDD